MNIPHVKTRILAILAIVAVAVAIPPVAKAQTPVAQLVTAYQAAFPDPAPPSPAKLAAIQAILAAPDVTAPITARFLVKEEQALEGAPNATPASWMPVEFAAYQAGVPRLFVNYLGSALKFGDPYKTAALNELANFESTQAGTSFALEAQALVAESRSQFDAAITAWSAAADTFDHYEKQRGGEILHIGTCSKKRHDAAATTNGLLIPYLSGAKSLNVVSIDGNFQAAYRLVNRSVMSTADARTFLIGVEQNVAATNVNAAFLGEVQSQLNLLPPN